MSFFDFEADRYSEDDKYSEKEIREYIKNNPDGLSYSFWWNISEFQNLSESFIREFQDKLNWYDISSFQKLSEEFLIEFIEKVNMFWLGRNKKIPKEVKDRIINLKKVIDQ